MLDFKLPAFPKSWKWIRGIGKKGGFLQPSDLPLL